MSLHSVLVESGWQSRASAWVTVPFGTDLLVNWNKTSKQCYDELKENASNRNMVMPAQKAVEEVVEHRISLFKNIVA